MLSNIPEELKVLKQWVSVSIEDGVKIPYIAGTNYKASSTDPSNWRTFDEAANDDKEHVGFVLTNSYVFIDLDDLEDPDQQKVYARFNTYSQRSVSGRGVHLICKGGFEGSGKHPTSPKAGIFQTGRYVLMTGDILDGRTTINPIPKEDIQTVHAWLSSGPEIPTTDLVEQKSNVSDEEVCKRANERYFRFKHLVRGEWQQFPDYNNNHSEADHALLQMFCNFTPSNEQVVSLFLRSGMCNEERAAKKGNLERYAYRSIVKARSKQKYLGIEIKNHVEFEEEKKPMQLLGSCSDIDAMPEGLMKRTASWLWETAEYPLQEAHLAATFATFAVMSGRNYQTFTGSGHNAWIVLLAGTGTGKNEYQNGISSILKAVSDIDPNRTKFMQHFVGELASGPSVEDTLAGRNRCLAYFAEFDRSYCEMTAPNAAPHHRSLKSSLLNTYMQSGENGYLWRRQKARQRGQDAPDETPIQAPCLVLGGESTPEAFYSKLSSHEVATGFLQRFSILHAKQESISRRPSPNARKKMPDDLARDLLEFFTRCDAMERDNEFVVVKPSKEAREMIREYRDMKRDNVIDGHDQISKECDTRAGLKVIRYASELAISANWKKPLVTTEHVKWAIQFVDDADQALLNQFASGAVGMGQNKQEADIIACFKTYAKMSTAQRKKAGIPEELAGAKEVLPHNFLKRKVVILPAFLEDRQGAVTAFERCLNHLTTDGQIGKADVNVWKLL